MLWCNTQTALDVPWVGKCAGENNGSTIDSIVLAKVARGRSSPCTTKNADWCNTRKFGKSETFCQNIKIWFKTIPMVHSMLSSC